MSQDINTSAFWDELDADMWDEVALLVIAVIMAGLESGITLLPSKAQPLINFDEYNAKIIEYARKYRFEWIRDITETARRQTIRIITDWLRSGSPLSVLADALTPLFGEARAKRIAVTEITRLYARGNQIAWEGTGFVGAVKWMTSKDDLVCPICAPLDGTIIGIGDIDAHPPAHVNCRCWIQPVLDESAFEKRLDEILGL